MPSIQSISHFFKLDYAKLSRRPSPTPSIMHPGPAEPRRRDRQRGRRRHRPPVHPPSRSRMGVAVRMVCLEILRGQSRQLAEESPVKMTAADMSARLLDPDTGSTRRRRCDIIVGDDPTAAIGANIMPDGAGADVEVIDAEVSRAGSRRHAGCNARTRRRCTIEVDRRAAARRPWRRHHNDGRAAQRPSPGRRRRSSLEFGLSPAGAQEAATDQGSHPRRRDQGA